MVPAGAEVNFGRSLDLRVPAESSPELPLPHPQLVRQRGALDGILQDFGRQELQLPEELRYGRDVVGKNKLADSTDQAVLYGRRNGAKQSEIDIAQSEGWGNVLDAAASSLSARAFVGCDNL